MIQIFNSFPSPSRLWRGTWWLCFLLLLQLSSCHPGNHFISDSTYREKVEKQFEKRKTEAASRADQLFGVFNNDLSLTEKEALKFLYAYMPLSDLADYDGEFYLRNVRASLAARDTFSWGKQVPEKLFRHFVLPVRVNNENLDSSRWVFFMELKDRIKNMPMKQAVLEVNHWCREKVSYRGTDGRTSSPLATVKTAYGRCGEESTFAVAALRSVGIPARQCYTPRWAHSDDNHAWVEVWVDSSWHYIGACEPEADLDVAWFTGPAKRAMLVNTNVFGAYEGPEDVLVMDPLFTRINILSNYAATRRIYAKVTDENRRALDSATVEFQLYNYAEFYPLHKTFTDKNGIASLLTGYGDLVIWASRGDKYGFQKVTVKQTDTAEIVLNLTAGKQYSLELDLVPPPEQSTGNAVPESHKAENSKRVAFEDKIRGNYEATFIDSLKSFRLAANLKLNKDTLWSFLRKSRGNWREIIDFVSGVASDRKSMIFPVLSSISEKDLHDITPAVLEDNLRFSPELKSWSGNNELFVNCILSPRVDNEWLRPYKQYFQKAFRPAFIDSARRDPGLIRSWILANIKPDLVSNYGRAPLTPVGAYELRTAESHSREILFVALCRSFGIAARLEPGSRVPQYFLDAKWTDVVFESKVALPGQRGTLQLSSDPKNDRKPEYFTHFTIEKFDHGFFRSLDYEYDDRFNAFPCSLELTPGYYLLVTGNRVAGGTVLADLRFFNISPDMKTEQVITLRKNTAPLPVIGTIDTKQFFRENTEGKPMQLNAGKGFVIAFMEPDKEPSRHFIADLKLKSAEFSGWKGNIILLFRSEAEKAGFIALHGSEMPAGLIYRVAGQSALKYTGTSLNRTLGASLPVILYLNPKSEVIYLSEGYRIGIGDDLTRLMKP